MGNKRKILILYKKYLHCIDGIQFLFAISANTFNNGISAKMDMRVDIQEYNPHSLTIYTAYIHNIKKYFYI